MVNRFAKSHATDTNQAAIITALEKVGCQCYQIERPVDLLIEYRGVWITLEIKNEKGKNQLTEAQDIFFRKTKAPACIARDPEDAIFAVNLAWKRSLQKVDNRSKS
jgi:hypothetical protein